MAGPGGPFTSTFGGLRAIRSVRDWLLADDAQWAPDVPGGRHPKYGMPGEVGRAWNVMLLRVLSSLGKHSRDLSPPDAGALSSCARHGGAHRLCHRRTGGGRGRSDRCLDQTRTFTRERGHGRRGRAPPDRTRRGIAPCLQPAPLRRRGAGERPSHLPGGRATGDLSRRPDRRAGRQRPRGRAVRGAGPDPQAVPQGRGVRDARRENAWPRARRRPQAS